MDPVVRAGDTVRRAAGPWTDTVHALLRHLRARGVSWVPEPRGRDAAGREVLAFIPGDVPRYPLPPPLWADALLVEAGRRLRQLHDATEGFDRAGRTWRLPARAPGEVVCHNDFGPHNFVLRDGALAGVIDFDTASPGPRVWDLAYLAYRLVPLTDPRNPDGAPFPAARRAVRLAALCAAYDGPAPAEVLRCAVPRLEELAAFTAQRAGAGGPPALRAHVALYERDAAYLRTFAP
jgi:aminoglycoside phosphotransferase (APT) family kinase protein